ALPAGLGDKVVKLAQAKGDVLKNLLIAESILIVEESPERHLHFSLEKYRALFHKYCLIIRQPRVMCSCWHFRHKGHCSHGWACEEWWQVRKVTPTPLPHAREALWAAPDEHAEAAALTPRRRRAA
ncbi:unnamed protein product, partial [Durusdinium trenchii]